MIEVIITREYKIKLAFFTLLVDLKNATTKRHFQRKKTFQDDFYED